VIASRLLSTVARDNVDGDCWNEASESDSLPRKGEVNVDEESICVADVAGVNSVNVLDPGMDVVGEK
jgi:hypothetical protein